MSLSFGAPSSAPATSGLSGFSFSSTPNKTTGFGLGQPTLGAASTPAFGAPSAAVTNAVSVAPLGGFSVSAPSATSAQSSGAGLGGCTTTTSASLFGSNLSAAASTAQSSAGSEPPRQQKLPNEVSSTVDAFTEFVRKQKALSSDVMRVSIKPLVKVSQQAEETLRAAGSAGGEATRTRGAARRLRAAAARALALAERAGRDQPDEGWGSLGYLQELVGELETQLMTCRRQTEAADRQMHASHRPLTQQELSVGMRRMHESLVALAGRLQSVHSQTEQQKRVYLALPARVVSDLEETSEPESAGLGAGPGRGRGGSAVLTDPRAALGSLQQATGPTPFSYLGTSLSTLAHTPAPVSPWSAPAPAPPALAPAPAAFQLQKPPKRGKQ